MLAGVMAASFSQGSQAKRLEAGLTAVSAQVELRGRVRELAGRK